MRVFPDTFDQGRKTHCARGGSSPTAGVANWIKRGELSTSLHVSASCLWVGGVSCLRLLWPQLETHMSPHRSHHSGLCPPNISQGHSRRASSLCHFCGDFVSGERVTNTTYILLTRFPGPDDKNIKVSVSRVSIVNEKQTAKKWETRDLK